jgi:alkaline phosphatase D
MDGYPYEREKFVNYLKKRQLKNLVIVTGDYHCSFAMETNLQGTQDISDNAAIEFVVTSITSANDDEYVTDKEVAEAKELYLKNNPHMKYCNNKDHGYLVLKVSKDELIAEFNYASTVKKPEATKITEKVYHIKSGSAVIVEGTKK